MLTPFQRRTPDMGTKTLAIRLLIELFSELKKRDKKLSLAVSHPGCPVCAVALACVP